MGFFDRLLGRGTVVPQAELGSSIVEAMAGQNPAMLASVGQLGAGGPPGIAVVPGNRTTDPRSKRARFYGKHVAFVRQTYRFVAFQAARPPLLLEISEDGGSEWQTLSIDLDPVGYEILAEIRPPNGGTQADLIRRAVYLDETIGEFNIIDVSDVPGLRSEDHAAFVVRDPNSCTLKRGVFTVKGSPNSKMTDGPQGMFQVPLKKVTRAWQPDEEWELMATSSLIGLVDDLDTMWDMARQIRRQSRSRLAMNDIFWTPTEAHSETIDLPNGQKTSKLSQSYATMASRRLNDLDDNEVNSVAPFDLNTPGLGPGGNGTMPVPQIIKMPGLDETLLTFLQDARLVVAASLPLSSSAIFDAMESKNHWGDWLADEQDVQVIEESLRRVLDAFTTAILRPALRGAAAAGMWRGDPDMVRIGVNLDLLRRDIDNSENVKWAADRGMITEEATIKGLHLKVADMTTDEQFAAWANRRRVVAEVTKAATPQLGAGMPGPLALPAAPNALPAGGAVPNGGEVPAVTAAASGGGRVPVVDDRWILGLPRTGG